MPHSTIILNSLHNVLRKDMKFIWSAEYQKSFDEINPLLCSQSNPKSLDPESPINIEMNARFKEVGKCKANR